jgi:acyl-CoA reductase-like NAD-dependent aldehyde dehydrogenase
MDLPQAATAVAEGIFLNAGQVCSACSRLLVQRSVKEELLEHLVQASGPWEPGDPLHEATKMGPVVDENQFSRVLASIARGREEGASVVIGGEPVVSPAEGYFVRPTIFTDVSNEMKLASEEIFGPVLSVIDFDTVHEAIALANDSSYGLAAGVWTRDVSTAHNVGRQLRAGSVYVNCWGEGDISMPFGGYKESGFGRDKSLHALDGYLEFKSTYIKLDKST